MRIAKVIAGLAVIASCALIMMKGAEFLVFAQVSERSDRFSAAVKPGQPVELDKIVALDKDLRAWIHVLGVQSLARERIIVGPTLISVSAQTIDQVEQDIVSALSIEPLNGHLWMRLANVRLLGGKSLEAVFTAFDMAALTAPRESNVVYERVEFGFAFWEILPAERRDRIAEDFVAFQQQIATGFGGREAGWLGFIIASKSEGIRADMRAHIKQRAGLDPEWLRRVGL